MTADQFRNIVRGVEELPVVLFFYLSWCGPCKTARVYLEEIAEEVGDTVLILGCNVEQSRAMAVELGVRNTPTFVFLKEGEVIEDLVGGKRKEVLREKITALI